MNGIQLYNRLQSLAWGAPILVRSDELQAKLEFRNAFIRALSEANLVVRTDSGCIHSVQGYSGPLEDLEIGTRCGSLFRGLSSACLQPSWDVTEWVAAFGCRRAACLRRQMRDAGRVLAAAEFRTEP